MYQALYRKYRPMDFDSVVGQDSIVKTLRNSIINNSFSHAYMFFGPRGTGKTTVSKIFARNINCLSPINGSACGKCSSCLVSFSKDCVDIIEIDAASNNGVDEIRELKNKISLVPCELKYKVYIIDEVHMLSDAAFNALLKTLEEPPEHAIFILATTDPQKVPETIISRCQCFSFKRISDNALNERLSYVCKTENILIDDEVISKISMLSDGGLRDALGMLDKLVSYSDSKITITDFNDVNGIISDSDLKLFLDSILCGNISDFLRYINDFNSCGKNLIQIIIQFINYLRDIIVDYYINNNKTNYSIDLLQDLINLLNEKLYDIKKSGNTKIYLEMLFLKFINENVISNKKDDVIIDYKNDNIIQNNFKKNNEKPNNVDLDNTNLNNNDLLPNNNIVNYDNNNDTSNASINNKDVIEESIVETNISTKILNIKDVMNVRINNTLASADKNLLKMELNNFNLLNDYTFDQEIGYIVCSLLDSKIRAVSQNYLIMSFEYDSNINKLINDIVKINEVYNKITNSNKKIAIITDSEWDNIKNDYILNLKNNIKYEILEEPELIFEDSSKNDIISSSAIDLFGDIVEVE